MADSSPEGCIDSRATLMKVAVWRRVRSENQMRSAIRGGFGGGVAERLKEGAMVAVIKWGMMNVICRCSGGLFQLCPRSCRTRLMVGDTAVIRVPRCRCMLRAVAAGILRMCGHRDSIVSACGHAGRADEQGQQANNRYEAVEGLSHRCAVRRSAQQAVSHNSSVNLKGRLARFIN